MCESGDGGPQTWLGGTRELAPIIFLLHLSWDLPWLAQPLWEGKLSYWGPSLYSPPVTLRGTLMQLAEKFLARFSAWPGCQTPVLVCDLRQLI